MTSHHITSLDTVQISSSKFFPKNKPLHCPKKTSQHFTSLHFLFHFIYLFVYSSYQPYTPLYFPIPKYNLLPFPSLPFTFYRLHFPSLVYNFLTLVLKIYVLPWEVPIAPSGSLFQSVIILFTKDYFPISVLCFLALIFQ
jgi:hypothetical protein